MMTSAVRRSVRTPLDLNALVAAVGDRTGGQGAVVTFLGLVRNHNVGRRVTIWSMRPSSRWRSTRSAASPTRCASAGRARRLALHHRIGRLEIGEASVAIAAPSPHRGDAFAACRYAIERVKQIAPIWKREFSTAATSGSRVRPPIPTTGTRAPKRSGVACA